MAIVDIFSKRQKKLRGEIPDVYQYSEIPNALRVQIVHIWMDTLGNEENYWHGKVNESYKLIVDTLCREYGIFRLSGSKDYGNRDYLNEFVNSFLNETDTERCLDFIELAFRVIDSFTRDYSYLMRKRSSEKADKAIHELNTRFKEHGVGYQFTDGEMIRVDSELIHSEIIKPALRLLNQRLYAGAHEEFLKAHEHYRHERHKESLNECLKSFESIMKAICDKRNWAYQSGDTAKKLIQTCLDNGLIPSFWQSNFNSLRSLLESSVPTGRNKLGGHGQGSESVSVPSHLVAYMLHMTASSIVFLAESEASMP